MDVNFRDAPPFPPARVLDHVRLRAHVKNNLDVLRLDMAAAPSSSPSTTNSHVMQCNYHSPIAKR